MITPMVAEFVKDRKQRNRRQPVTGRQAGWITAVSAWMCVPVVRLVKHVLTIYLTPRPEHLYLNSHARGFHVRGCGTRNRHSDLDSQRGLQDFES